MREVILLAGNEPLILVGDVDQNLSCTYSLLGISALWILARNGHHGSDGVPQGLVILRDHGQNRVRRGHVSCQRSEKADIGGAGEGVAFQMLVDGERSDSQGFQLGEEL